MFNILPPEELAERKREYLFRLAGAILLLTAFAFVVGITTLLPGLILSHQKEIVAQSSDALLAQELQRQSKNDLISALVAGREKADALISGSDRTPDYELISLILQNKVTGVTMNGFDVKAGGNGVRYVTVHGHASDRDTLDLLQKTLGKVTEFSNVVVPTSDFAHAIDIDFSLALTVK